MYVTSLFFLFDLVFVQNCLASLFIFFERLIFLVTYLSSFGFYLSHLSVKFFSEIDKWLTYQCSSECNNFISNLLRNRCSGIFLV